MVSIPGFALGAVIAVSIAVGVVLAPELGGLIHKKEDARTVTVETWTDPETGQAYLVSSTGSIFPRIDRASCE